MGVAPTYLRAAIRLSTSATSLRPLRSMDRRELFVPWTRTTIAMSRSFSLIALLVGIAAPLQLVLLSYHPIFLHVRPYHFLNLVSFLGANRTKSASVCLWLLRGAIQILKYNTILILNDRHDSWPDPNRLSQRVERKLNGVGTWNYLRYCCLNKTYLLLRICRLINVDVDPLVFE